MKAKIIVLLMWAMFFGFGAADAQRRKTVTVAPRVATRVYHPVVVRKAHVRYTAMPRWGASVNVVPTGAVAVGARRNSYYAHNGVYYRHAVNGYAVVRPSRGLRVTILPTGYRTVMVGPRSYFYYYGTYYSQNSPNQYQVVDPPLHAVVDALPDGYEVVQLDGNEYYVLDGVYYAEVDAPEFEDGIGYEVVRVN